MEKVFIEIHTGNAAFDADPNKEAAMILRKLADKLEQGNLPGFVRDINGNKVGIVSNVSAFESMWNELKESVHNTKNDFETSRQDKDVYSYVEYRMNEIEEKHQK